MKALSLWQPWASLWLSPRKVHETRGWSTPHRGWLLVHAAKRIERNIDPADPLHRILVAEFGARWARDLPTGALIGVVKLIGCRRTDLMFAGGVPESARDDHECGDFHPGRFAWQRADFRRFETPVPYRGRQGMFDVPLSALPEPYCSGWVA